MMATLKQGRCHSRWWSLLAITVVAALCNNTLCGQQVDQPPNILLIVSEDNGPELGCYGDAYVQTPVLDALAEDGVRFHNAYVPQAGCSQSRAALLTGLYPHQNGQIGLATWKFSMYREDTPNVVRSLKQSGYRTGIIGKLHVNPASAFPFDMHEISSSNFGRKDLGRYAKVARQFFEGEAPFFLSVNYPDAHRPFTSQVDGLPERLLTANDVKPLPYFGLDSPELRQETAAYYNCMARLDALIGDLLRALKESGKADNTLVIYLGDHGADLLRGKRTSYEGGVRVPLIVHWPGKTKANHVCQRLVSSIDIFPTLLAASGTEPIDSLPGRSLEPLLRGDEQAPWRDTLFTEFHLHSAHNFYPQRTIRNARYKLIHNLQPNVPNPGYDFTMRRFFPGLSAAIEEASPDIRAAYMRMKTPPEFELYDLSSDPYEFRNLADDDAYANVKSELANELAAWRARTHDPFLKPRNLSRLKSEIDACFDEQGPSKQRLRLNYTRYFMAADP